jgi:hypothetical protein
VQQRHWNIQQQVTPSRPYQIWQLICWKSVHQLDILLSFLIHSTPALPCAAAAGVLRLTPYQVGHNNVLPDGVVL